MIGKKRASLLAAVLALVLLPMALFGCGRDSGADAPAEAQEAGGQDSERYAQSAPEGIWQTASIVPGDDGEMRPEYHVRFTDTEVVYGHLKDGDFVFDHADRIVRLEQSAAGGSTVRAEASNGVRYTYKTSENDRTVLEYFETWQDEAFPESYRGGASLSRYG